MPHVFVVDDEYVIATTLSLILQHHGYSATAFHDPQQLLEVARQQAPCIVISDVVMPGMNGVELAMQLRREHPECRVLLFSGQAATANFLESVPPHEKPFRVLAKPIHPDALLQELRALAAEAA